MNSLKSYTIKPASGAVALVGDAAAGDWASADVAHIDIFPWYKAGQKQATSVRLLYDDAAIYGQFICEDVHIFAEHTELNSAVCQDSCVELFASYKPDVTSDYFNIEINCCGTILVGHGPDRASRGSITPELAEKIQVVTSIAGPTKDESSDDNGWWVAFRLPLEVVSEMAGCDVAAEKGGRWRGNFFRCGGRTDNQHAQWNPIDTNSWPRPDFHRPESFGEFVFE